MVVPPSRPGRPHAAFAAALLLAAALSPGLVPGGAMAQATDGPGGDQLIEGSRGGNDLTLNLKGADILALIDAVSEMTGRNFVVDPRVQGQVTVVSVTPMNPQALYEVFLSILKVHGYAAVPSGKVVKIVPDLSGRQDGTRVGGDFSGAPPDEIVTLVTQLRNVDAPDVLTAVQPLLPPTGQLAAHVGSNTVIVSDSAGNARRIADIVARIDRSMEREVEVMRLQYADAVEVARVIGTLRPPGRPEAGATAGGPALVADERSNSLLFGGTRAVRLELRALIAHLDAPIERVGDTEVVYLRYARADDLVEVLQDVAESVPGAPPAEGAARQGRAGGQTGGAGFRVQADVATNALILQADPERMRVLKSVIGQLDVRRAQVFVEGVIAEVSDTQSSELGVQWRLGGDSAEGGTTFPGTESGSIDLFPGDPVSLGTGLSLGYLRGGSVRALLRALAGDNATNVLSTPTLTTMDNEEAEIVVGQNVPFVTGQFTNQATTPDNPFQTIERQDVGILLKVKPQITEGDSVHLYISQEVSSVERGTSGSDLITNKRAIKTSVLADDGQIIVIGGLIGDDLKENIQKVPLLGDIPVLGNLFRNRRTDRVRTNLMVFLRPVIIRDRAGSTNLTVDRYERIRGLQRQGEYDPVSLWPREPAPMLPELPPPGPPGGSAPAPP